MTLSLRDGKICFSRSQSAVKASTAAALRFEVSADWSLISSPESGLRQMALNWESINLRKPHQQSTELLGHFSMSEYT